MPADPATPALATVAAEAATPALATVAALECTPAEAIVPAEAMIATLVGLLATFHRKSRAPITAGIPGFPA